MNLVEPDRTRIQPAADSLYDFVLNRKPPRIPGEPFASVGFALLKRYMRWEDAR